MINAGVLLPPRSPTRRRWIIIYEIESYTHFDLWQKGHGGGVWSWLWTPVNDSFLWAVLPSLHCRLRVPRTPRLEINLRYHSWSNSSTRSSQSVSQQTKQVAPRCGNLYHCVGLCILMFYTFRACCSDGWTNRWQDGWIAMERRLIAGAIWLYSFMVLELFCSPFPNSKQQL